ncbi:MAG: ABC transporter substrate-binding protein [Candidatus Paceibacterota bacterium]
MPSFLKLNLPSKLPSRRQWTQFFKLLNPKEKKVFFSFLFLFLASSLFLYFDFYFRNTIAVPQEGGRIKEGFVGQPQYINPLLSFPSEIDKSLVELLFSGLMTYDQNGEIIPDLIKSYEFKDDGKTFEFSIKENAKWQDGKPLTMEDVIFTIDLVQNSKSLSLLRPNWQGVTIEKISENDGRLKLKQPYSGLLENLAVLKIIPEHIWANIQPENFALNTDLNIFNPVGSGPFKVKQVKQRKDKSIESITLTKNDYYSGKKAYLDEVDFIFFSKKEDLISALKRKQIQSARLESYKDYDPKTFKSFELTELQAPKYFAAFFNLQKKIFSEKDIREAFTMATDRNEIIQSALESKASAVDSPILPAYFGFNSSASVYPFDIEKAKSLLANQDFVAKDGQTVKTVEKLPKFQLTKDLVFGNKGTEVERLQECLAKDSDVYPEGTVTGEFGDKTKAAVIKFQEKYASEILAPSNLTKGNGKVLAGTREKLNQLCYPAPTEETSLSFSLTTVNNPDLIKIAEILKNQWEKIGAKVEIKLLNEEEINKAIRERNFEVLLFEESLSSIPDPLPFWHSLQIIDPGLNVSGYENKKADELLVQARKYYGQKDPNRQKTLEEFQDIVIGDAPAVFLCNQDYFYLTDRSIKGIEIKKIVESSKIFSDLSNWYVQTQRQWKK